jgi:hypothetical protein
MSKNEVALFGEKETMPAHIQTGTGKGMDMGQDDVAMPYIKMLQAMSPEIDEIEGAKAGKLINSITQELYDEIHVINLHYRRQYSIFKKRDLGGGYEGAHDSREAAMHHLENVVQANPADYDIQETHTHICLLLDDNGQLQQPVIINMSGSKVQVSRKWNTDIMTKHKGADRFSSVWKIEPRKQSNSKGSWYNMNITWEGFVNEALYLEASEYFDQVSGSSEAA